MSIQPTRIQTLNEADIRRGDYVLYWMQQSQRASHNHALEYAVQQANKLDRMLLVVFGLMDGYPEANLRHYSFMLEGLKETMATLAARGIKMVLRRGHPSEVALKLGRRASMMVCDRGYLRHQRAWREQVAQEVNCRVMQVESDVLEMKHTGFMHNYMRMYWGKKIMEWSATPQEAFRTTLAINNKYFLDGRDPNSYTGVGWIYGVHDRAWAERPIFGKTRYMAASGLERKCDIAAYVKKVDGLGSNG